VNLGWKGREEGFIVSIRRVQMKRFKCPRCGRDKRSAGGLVTHMRWSKSCGLKGQPAEKVESLPAPARASAPSSHESIASTKGQKPVWDINWSQAQKEASILRDSGFEWGIGRRGGRWVPVPVLGGMGYDEAVIAADKRNAISRIQPVLAVHRPSQPAQEQEDNTRDDLFLAMMLLDTL